MIIIDLDGTLADCEHRRHFVDPTMSVNHILMEYDGKGAMIEEKGMYCHILTGEKFKPDWKSFYEACDQDTVIQSVNEVLGDLAFFHHIQIWSGRCESVRQKTLYWLFENTNYNSCMLLKMRPIGDFTPDEQLKEKWLDEAIAEGKKIDFVCDDRKKVVDMWRRRGKFVFDCNQTGKEF